MLKRSYHYDSASLYLEIRGEGWSLPDDVQGNLDFLSRRAVPGADKATAYRAVMVVDRWLDKTPVGMLVDAKNRTQRLLVELRPTED